MSNNPSDDGIKIVGAYRFRHMEAPLKLVDFCLPVEKKHLARIARYVEAFPELAAQIEEETGWRYVKGRRTSRRKANNKPVARG